MYRIDGGDWESYQGIASPTMFMAFLASTGVMHPMGNNGITPFAFHNSEIFSASFDASLPTYSIGGDPILGEYNKVTTVEFRTTDSGGHDLVSLLFGGDITLKSCASVYWDAL